MNEFIQSMLRKYFQNTMLLLFIAISLTSFFSFLLRVYLGVCVRFCSVTEQFLIICEDVDDVIEVDSRVLQRSADEFFKVLLRLLR